MIKYLNNDRLAKQIELEQSMLLLSAMPSSVTYLSASATYGFRNHGVISVILHHPTFWKISTMTHQFVYLFWKGRAKRDFIFYSFAYRDFKYYGWRNMEEFEKEGGRVSEETQMSAVTQQADGSRVSYRSTCARVYT